MGDTKELIELFTGEHCAFHSFKVDRLFILIQHSASEGQRSQVLIYWTLSIQRHNTSQAESRWTLALSIGPEVVEIVVLEAAVFIVLLVIVVDQKSINSRSGNIGLIMCQ